MIAVALAVAALAIALWLGARGTGHSADSVSDDASLSRPLESAPDAAAAGGLPGLARRSSDSAPEAPLPAAGTPLAGNLDELIARADQGDYRAACRLAFELHVCNRDLPVLEVRGQHAENQIMVDPNQVSDAQLQFLENRLVEAQAQLEGLEAAQAHCRDVPPISTERRLGWWRQAAVAGSRAALHEMMDGDALPFHEWLRHTDHLSWMNRELEPLAWRAMQAGDLEAATHLLNALRPRPAPNRMELLAQATQVDEETAAALAMYLHEVLPSAEGSAESIASMRGLAQVLLRHKEASLAPEVLERARATSREWRRTITPLPVTTSPRDRGAIEFDPVEKRRAQMELCAEPSRS